METKSVNKNILMDSLKQSFVKLAPRVQVKNPVMFVVYIGAILTTALYFLALAGIKDENSGGYILAIALILWFTVLFANFAEAIAEGRGRAQAATLRQARKDIKAKKLKSAAHVDEYTEVLSADLKKRDIVYVKAGDQIPMDGEVLDGAASVDESAITGESA
ncbi:MAG TPA: potassium-transporting ATPase subunit B, partial [Pelotomaculum sp.]|nr:potassium-transporting ATPase subunit B [Pelotomaculum sp.]